MNLTSSDINTCRSVIQFRNHVDPNTADELVTAALEEFARKPREVENVRGWIISAAGLILKNRRYRDRRDVIFDSDCLDHRSDDQSRRCEPNPRQIERVRAAVDSLNPAQREVVRLHFFERLPFAEISHRLEIPCGTAKSRCNRALSNLASLLRSSCGSPEARR